MPSAGTGARDGAVEAARSSVIDATVRGELTAPRGRELDVESIAAADRSFGPCLGTSCAGGWVQQSPVRGTVAGQQAGGLFGMGSAPESA